MTLSVLFNKLRNNKPLQICFAFLPVLLIIVYIGLYMWNISSMYYIFHNNDKVATISLNTGKLKRLNADTVDLYNNVYSLTANDLEDISFDVRYDSLIYRVSLSEEDTYRYELGNGVVLSSNYCSLIDSCTADSDGFKIAVSNSVIPITINEWFVELYLTNDGSYRLHFNSETITDEYRDLIDGLTVESIREDFCTFSINMMYNVSISDFKLNFCTILPTDDSYIDLESMCLVKNITPHFAKNLILGSNIVVVLVSMFIYVVMLCILGRHFDLKMFYRKEVIGVNLFALFLLSSCIPLTCLMF